MKEKNKSPFLEYQSNSKTKIKITGGKQKKHSIAGIYTNVINNKKYYIKKTMDETVTDDVAELLFPILCRAILYKKDEKLIANCLPVIRLNPENNKTEMFVASEVANNWSALHNFGMIAAFTSYYIKRIFGYQTSPDKIRDDISKANCSEDLYKILVLCALFNEYDIGPQNIGLSDNKKLVKIDHGWALTGVATKENHKIGFHDVLFMIGKRAPNTKLRVTPTNHLMDWIDSNKNLVIDSTEFANTMLAIAKSIRAKGSMRKIVEKSINELLKLIRVELQKNKISKENVDKFEHDIVNKIIIHTGVKLPKISKKNKIKSFEILKEALIKSLSSAMDKRVFSMECSSYTTKINNLIFSNLSNKLDNKNKIIKDLNLLAKAILLEKDRRLVLKDNDFSLNSVIDGNLVIKYKKIISHFNANFDDYLKYISDKCISNNINFKKLRSMLAALTVFNDGPKISKTNIEKLDNLIRIEVGNELKLNRHQAIFSQYLKSSFCLIGVGKNFDSIDKEKLFESLNLLGESMASFNKLKGKNIIKSIFDGIHGKRLIFEYKNIINHLNNNFDVYMNYIVKKCKNDSANFSKSEIEKLRNSLIIFNATCSNPVIYDYNMKKLEKTYKKVTVLEKFNNFINNVSSSKNNEYLNISKEDKKKLFLHLLANNYKKGGKKKLVEYANKVNSYWTGKYKDYFDLKDKKGNSPFHLAAKKGNIDFIVTALEKTVRTSYFFWSYKIEDIVNLEHKNNNGNNVYDLLLKNSNLFKRLEALKTKNKNRNKVIDTLYKNLKEYNKVKNNNKHEDINALNLSML